MEVHFDEHLPVPVNGIKCPAGRCSSLRPAMGHTLHAGQNGGWYRAFLNMVKKVAVYSNAPGAFAFLFSIYFKFVNNF